MVIFPLSLMVAIVKDMVSSDCLTGNSPLIYQRYIQVAKLLFQRPINLISFEYIGRRKQELGRLTSYASTMKPCSHPGQRKVCFSSMLLASTSETRWSTIRSTLSLSTKEERVTCANELASTRNTTQPAAPPFLRSSVEPILRTRLQSLS